MRCPSCGTENAPDSRFCGGCGARLGASAQRLAPTQKISDDAIFPQRPAAGGGHGGQAVAQPGGGPRLVPPAAYAPGGLAPQPSAPQPSAPQPRAISSAPPSVQATSPATARPPNGSARQPQVSPRTSQLDDPSLSMPIVARRPWGLIIFLLVLDLGLGAAGIWMLSEGLGDKPSAKSAAPRSGASATPASAVASGATGAPIEPRTTSAPAGSEANAAAATGAAAPATGTGAPTAAAPATGSAAPAASAEAPAPATGSAAPGSAMPASNDATAGAGSKAAPADKPVKRHRKAEKKPTGAASGPVDPYATSAPRPAPSPPASP